MSPGARTVILLTAWWLGAASVAAGQAPETGRADSLAAVLHRLTARIDSLESGHCPDTTRLALPAPSGNARADSLLAVTADLDRRLRAFRDQRCAVAAPPAPAAPADTSARALPASEPQAPWNASASDSEGSGTGDIPLVARDGHRHDNGDASRLEVGRQSTLDDSLYPAPGIGRIPDREAALRGRWDDGGRSATAARAGAPASTPVGTAEAAWRRDATARDGGRARRPGAGPAAGGPDSARRAARRS